MRIWSLHPRYLDPQGLVALWRETLLAQAVLYGLTRGYTQHPQLLRFKQHAQPLHAIASYLHGVHDEATLRGYHFDASKILGPRDADAMPVGTDQLAYEWQHLLAKLQLRSPTWYARWEASHLQATQQPDCHPLFTVHTGPIASWERP